MAQNTVMMKVFVQRDYSRGTNCRFMTEMPVELQGKIDDQTFQHTIQGINEIMDDAEKIGLAAYFENCLGCLTGYLSLLCFETQYDKCLKRLTEYIDQQNANVYVPQGLMITNPMDRGLRVFLSLDRMTDNLLADVILVQFSFTFLPSFMLANRSHFKSIILDQALRLKSAY